MDRAMVPSGNADLYEAVTSCLSCALQPHNQVQNLNNDRIKKLEVVEEYPLILCQIIGSTDEAIPERHLASVFLKNYLEKIFDRKLENSAFVEKELGKKMAFMLLQLSNIRDTSIKLMVCYSLALICGMGYWNVINVQLSHMAQSRNESCVNYVVLVLAQLIDKKFFVSGYNMNIESDWCFRLVDIFRKTYISAEIRTMVIRPIYLMMKYVIHHMVSRTQCWITLSIEFQKALREPFSVNSNFEFKREIIKYLNRGLKEYNSFCHIFIPPSLPIVANLLTHCREMFKKVIQGVEENLPKDISEDDSDPIQFTELVVAILNYIKSMIGQVYFGLLLDDLENLLYCIFIFMSSYSGVEYFVSNDGTDTGYASNMRRVGSEIIMETLDKLNETRANGKTLFFQTLNHVFLRFIHEFEEPHEQPNALYKTRITEALVFGLCLVHEEVPLRGHDYVFPVDYYINYWTKVQADTPTDMLIVARISILCGIFAVECKPDVIDYQIKKILENIKKSRHVYKPLVKALCHFLNAYDKLGALEQATILFYASRIILCFIKIAYKEDDFPLHYTLRALGFLIRTFKQLSTDNLDRTEDLLISIVSKHISNPQIFEEIVFVVANLARNGNFKSFASEKFLSYMCGITFGYTSAYMKMYLDKALEILNVFIHYSPFIEECLIQQLFLGAIKLLNRETEPEFLVDESAAVLLTTLFVKESFKLSSDKCRCLIQLIPETLVKMLHPDVILPPHVGVKFVIVILSEFDDVMVAHHEKILRSVITSSCKYRENIVPCWMIFAYICMLNTTATLHFLTAIPGPSGGSALNYMMQIWKPEYINNLDPLEQKILVLAVTNIIKNCMRNHTNYVHMEKITITYDTIGQSLNINLNGVEYLYYLIIQIVVDEDILGQGATFHDEDGSNLFQNHPMNINIIHHVSSFLKPNNEIYFNVLRKCSTHAVLYRLKYLGLLNSTVNILEDME